jgi:hypothetical protein
VVVEVRGRRRPGHGQARASDDQVLVGEERASLRSLRPFWRAPRMVPSPRSSRSTSARTNPSVVRSMASSRASARANLVLRQQVAPGRLAAPAHPPRSWWSWAMPNRSASSMTMTEASGMSTPTSMTVVATSTSRSTGPELGHDPLLLRRGSCPWRRPTRRPASSCRPAARPRPPPTAWTRCRSPRPAGRPRRPGARPPPRIGTRDHASSASRGSAATRWPRAGDPGAARR